MSGQFTIGGNYSFIIPAPASLPLSVQLQGAYINLITDTTVIGGYQYPNENNNCGAENSYYCYQTNGNCSNGVCTPLQTAGSLFQITNVNDTSSSPSNVTVNGSVITPSFSLVEVDSNGNPVGDVPLAVESINYYPVPLSNVDCAATGQNDCNLAQTFLPILNSTGTSIVAIQTRINDPYDKNGPSYLGLNPTTGTPNSNHDFHVCTCPDTLKNDSTP